VRSDLYCGYQICVPESQMSWLGLMGSFGDLRFHRMDGMYMYACALSVLAIAIGDLDTYVTRWSMLCQQSSSTIRETFTSFTVLTTTILVYATFGILYPPATVQSQVPWKYPEISHDIEICTPKPRIPSRDPQLNKHTDPLASSLVRQACLKFVVQVY